MSRRERLRKRARGEQQIQAGLAGRVLGERDLRIGVASLSEQGGGVVRVETWDVSMPGYIKEELIHTSVTRTDLDGGWSVPGRATLRFALPVSEMPAVGDELTIQVADMASVHLALDFRHDSRGAGEEASAMRVPWDWPPPWSAVS